MNGTRRKCDSSSLVSLLRCRASLDCNETLRPRSPYIEHGVRRSLSPPKLTLAWKQRKAGRKRRGTRQDVRREHKFLSRSRYARCRGEPRRLRHKRGTRQRRWRTRKESAHSVRRPRITDELVHPGVVGILDGQGGTKLRASPADNRASVIVPRASRAWAFASPSVCDVDSPPVS